MKHVFLILAMAVPPTVCVCASFYLLLHGNKEGWGWFLFVAICLAGSVNIGNSKDED